MRVHYFTWNVQRHRAMNERDQRQLTTGDRWTTLLTVSPPELDYVQCKRPGVPIVWAFSFLSPIAISYFIAFLLEVNGCAACPYHRWGTVCVAMYSQVITSCVRANRPRR